MSLCANSLKPYAECKCGNLSCGTMKLKPGFREANKVVILISCKGCGTPMKGRQSYGKGHEWPYCSSCATEDDLVWSDSLQSNYVCYGSKDYGTPAGCGKKLTSGYQHRERDWIALCAKCAGKDEPFKQEYPVFKINHDGYYSFDGKEIKSLEKGGIMSVVNKVKQLAKSKDQKLLEKYYVTNDCGELTEDGKELVLEKAFNQYKSDIVEDLKKIESEENSKK